jgi:hypothetical protein
MVEHDGRNQVKVTMVGATFWTDKVIRSLRRRLDPVAQGQPPFTTMADSAGKAALFLVIWPKVAPLYAMRGRIGPTSRRTMMRAVNFEGFDE